MDKVNEKRINYLFQLSNLMNHSLNQDSLSRYYVYLGQRITKRLVKRLDKSLKRTFCKECFTLFKFENKRIKKNKCISKCHVCKKVKVCKLL